MRTARTVSRRVGSLLVFASLLAACGSTSFESGTTQQALDGAGSDTATAEAATAQDASDDSTVEQSNDAVVVDVDEAAVGVESADDDSTNAPSGPATTLLALSGWDAVDRYLDTTLIRGGSAAASVSVMRNGRIEHVSAFGTRVEGEPTEPNDRFRVASISKTVTAVTALRLVEAGVLSLDDPIGSLLADRLGVDAPASGVEAISVRDLVTHRSGLGQYENLFFNHEVDSCRAAAVVGLSRNMQGAPGTGFQYSNLNFCLLGILIEEVSGQPYQSVVQAEVLDPLGISDMRLAGTFDVADGDVEHRSDEGRNYMETLEAAGAWIASPSDLVAVLNALDASTPGTKLLPPEMLALMQTITVTPAPPAEIAPGTEPGANAIEPGATATTTPTTTTPTTTTVPPPPTSGYGMGLMIFGTADGDGLSFGHTGTVESTHAMMVRRPDGYTWALTVSGDYPASTRDLAKIMDNALLLGDFTDGAYTTVPLPLTSE